MPPLESLEVSQGTWTKRPWCVWTAAALVVLGAILNTIYLFNHCPLDLTEDEAQYWQWSQHLDYGYYSKPPGIACVMWLTLRMGGALGLTGDGSGAALAPVLRMAAVCFGLCSGLISLFLARRMFRDDRVSLAVTALSAAVPMFAIGSLLITIDSPMYLSWAATVYCLWRAIEATEIRNEKSKIKNAAWLYAAGLCAAVGMLFKPVLIAIPISAVLAAWRDRSIRSAFATRHALGALIVMALSQVPVLMWNAQHNWVTLRHILTQGGMLNQGQHAEKSIWTPLARIGEYVGGQAGGMGGLTFVLLVIAAVVVFRRLAVRWPRDAADLAKTPPVEQAQAQGSKATRWVFLWMFFAPLWFFYFIMNLWKGTEVNWPAASYFTGMILLAGIFNEGWNAADAKHRCTWRSWGTATVLWGVLITSLLMNAHRVYGMVAEKLAPLAGTPQYFKSWWHPKKWEAPIVDKLLGMDARARAVQQAADDLQKQTGRQPLIVGVRYGISSSLTFYLPGHPFVYCIMSNLGERQSQFDIWPGLDQRDAAGVPLFAGRPAVIVANDKSPTLDEWLKKTFAHVEPPVAAPVVVQGVELKTVVIYKAEGFKQAPPPPGGLY